MPLTEVCTRADSFRNRRLTQVIDTLTSGAMIKVNSASFQLVQNIKPSKPTADRPSLMIEVSTPVALSDTCPAW